MYPSKPITILIWIVSFECKTKWNLWRILLIFILTDNWPNHIRLCWSVHSIDDSSKFIKFIQMKCKSCAAAAVAANRKCYRRTNTVSHTHGRQIERSAVVVFESKIQNQLIILTLIQMVVAIPSSLSLFLSLCLCPLSSINCLNYRISFGQKLNDWQIARWPKWSVYYSTIHLLFCEIFFPWGFALLCSFPPLADAIPSAVHSLSLLICSKKKIIHSQCNIWTFIYIIICIFSVLFLFPFCHNVEWFLFLSIIFGMP